MQECDAAHFLRKHTTNRAAICENTGMKSRTLSLLALASVFTVAGCERKTVVVQIEPPAPLAEPVAKTRTLETSRLGSAVDSFDREPSDANHAVVKKALAELDGEIAELEELVAKRTGSSREEAAVKLKNLQAYRAAEVTRFTVAQAKAPLTTPGPVDARSGADKVEDTAKRVGNSIEDAAQKAGDVIKDAVR